MRKLAQKFLHLTELPASEWRRSYEIQSPWVIYFFRRTDLQGMIFGGKIQMTCAFCGETTTVRIPQHKLWFPKYYNPTGRSMPARERFLEKHQHHNEPTWNKLAWAMPLANLDYNPSHVQRTGARDEGGVH